MNKKMTIMAVLAMCACAAFASPHRGPGLGGPRRGMGPRPAPVMTRGGYHHSSAWCRGGRNFWPGFVGGVIGGVVANAITTPAPVVVSQPAPVVVQQPVVVAPSQVVTPTPVVVQPTYVTQQVWVPGRYIDQVQANGTIVRVWQPGHYEQRRVLVQ